MILEAFPVEVEVALQERILAMEAGDVDRTADVRAVVVFLVGRLLGARSGAVLEGVEVVVAQILVAGAVELLAAALGFDDDLSRISYTFSDLQWVARGRTSLLCRNAPRPAPGNSHPPLHSSAIPPCFARKVDMLERLVRLPSSTRSARAR